MQNQKVRDGIYPTMITPYREDGGVDEEALRQLVRWYGEKGCHGIFAACQSSEIFYLSQRERERLVEVVKEEVQKLSGSPGQMTVVASGHVSASPGEQAEELMGIYEAGADAVVLISNRLDISEAGTGAWLRDLECLLDRLPADMPLGLYECPTPYKRLLNREMLEAVRDTGRFCFIKDTCCDPELLEERAKLLKGSGLKLFNANAQTFHASLEYGGSGYCGVMANFHPELFVWLYEHYQEFPEEAAGLGDLLSMVAFTECLSYPVTAKYYLSHYENIKMGITSRSCPKRELTEYEKLILEQLFRFSEVCIRRLAGV